MTLKPEFHFLEVAYPYVARRLLTDEDPALRGRLFQVLFQDGKFQWKRLENLIALAKEGSRGGKDTASGYSSSSSSGRAGSGASASSSSSPAFGGTLVPARGGTFSSSAGSMAAVAGASGSQGGLDLSDTVKDALRVLLLDDKLRTQVWLSRP